MTIANARPSRGVEIAWPRPVDFRLSNGFVQYRVRGTAAWISVFNLADVSGINEQIVLATLQARGFTVGDDGKLHLPDLEAATTLLRDDYDALMLLVKSLQEPPYDYGSLDENDFGDVSTPAGTGSAFTFGDL